MENTRSVKVTIYFEVYDNSPPIQNWTWEELFDPSLMPHPPMIHFENLPHAKPS